MSSMKPTLILIAGLPGVGKTTFARALEALLGCHIIYKDKYLEEFSEHGLVEGDDSFAAHERSFNEVRDALGMVRNKRYPFVILDCACLGDFVTTRCREIVDGVQDAQFKAILLVADNETRKNRIQNRPKQITRDRVHPASRNEYMQLYKHLPLDTLVLDTGKGLFEENLVEIKRYIVGSLAEPASDVVESQQK